MSQLIDQIAETLEQDEDDNNCLFWVCCEIQYLLKEKEKKAEQLAIRMGDYTPQLGKIHFNLGCNSPDYITLLERYETRRPNWRVRWQMFGSIIDQGIAVMLLLRVIQHDADDGSYIFDEEFAIDFNSVFETELKYEPVI
jgi:hypothetical protein